MKNLYKLAKLLLYISIIKAGQKWPGASPLVSDFISQDRSAYSAAGKYVDQLWEYINRSQTHECGGTKSAQFLLWKYIKRDFCCSVGLYTLQHSHCLYKLSHGLYEHSHVSSSTLTASTKALSRPLKMVKSA